MRLEYVSYRPGLFRIRIRSAADCNVPALLYMRLEYVSYRPGLFRIRIRSAADCNVPALVTSDNFWSVFCANNVWKMLRLTSALKHEIKPDETSYIEFFFVVKANNIR